MSGWFDKVRAVVIVIRTIERYPQRSAQVVVEQSINYESQRLREGIRQASCLNAVVSLAPCPRFIIKNRSIKSIFTEFYEPIGDREMISGSGSDLVQTAAIARAIPELIKELKVKTMLDAPCGDFYWMRCRVGGRHLCDGIMGEPRTVLGLDQRPLGGVFWAARHS